MFENEINKYKALNKFAEADGVVVFGGSEELNLPVAELKQGFALNDNIYNRSFSGIKIADASEVYEECIAELCPDTVILHIGDPQDFANDEMIFETNYRALIRTIKAKNKRCRIVIVSQKNDNGNPEVEKLNLKLKAIAKSAKCDFEDITKTTQSAPSTNNEAVPFIYDIGFSKPLNIRRPIFNLVRVLFCYAG